MNISRLLKVGALSGGILIGSGYALNRASATGTPLLSKIVDEVNLYIVTNGIPLNDKTEDIYPLIDLIEDEDTEYVKLNISGAYENFGLWHSDPPHDNFRLLDGSTIQRLPTDPVTNSEGDEYLIFGLWADNPKINNRVVNDIENYYSSWKMIIDYDCMSIQFDGGNRNNFYLPECKSELYKPQPAYPSE